MDNNVSFKSNIRIVSPKRFDMLSLKFYQKNTEFIYQYNLDSCFGGIDYQAYRTQMKMGFTKGVRSCTAGLIVANDLIYRNGQVLTDHTKHPDGAAEFKRPHARKINKDDAEIIDKIIRNTYKVLFTRGQKGCYLYVMDNELREYLKKRINELKMIS